jgi:hypothetical protein
MINLMTTDEGRCFFRTGAGVAVPAGFEALDEVVSTATTLKVERPWPFV